MQEIKTMRDIIDFAAETYGEQPAFRYKVRKELEEKTYRQLKEDTNRMSRMLESSGMLGKHVAVIGPTTYEWIVTYFGTANSGGVIVPIDAGLPAEEVCELLNRADVSMLIYDSLRKDVAKLAKTACKEVEQCICMQEELWETLNRHNSGFSCDLDADKMCAILFTSGTTGKSKGVMLTHRNLTDNAVCLDMRIPKGSVSMTLLPIHHAYCFTMDILKGIYIGLTICINDSIMHASKNFKRFAPEIVLMVPMVVESVYKKLQDASKLLPKKMAAKAGLGGRLTTICSGGAYLDPEYARGMAEYGITVLQGYGMTECSPVISTNLSWENKIGSVGKLMPNCEAKTVDSELWVRGSSVMLGYYKMPEETAETLVDGWLRTGDLGYVDEDGFVFLTGRIKNLIILNNGENVSPEELENELVKSPLVKEVIVRGKEAVIEAEIYPDEEYIKKKHVKDVDAKLQGVIDEYNQGLPAYKKIHALKVRDTEFEKTPSKKIKRNL